MTRRFPGWVALAAAGLGACGGDATGGDGGGGGSGGGGGGSAAIACGEHPLSCEAGQTCWFGASGFVCTPSGAGKEGETCAPLVGKATCDDGLLCVKAGEGEGVCARLCDTTVGNSCGEGLCVLVQTKEGFETHVCG